MATQSSTADCQVLKLLEIEPFHGNLADALEARPRTRDGKRKFTGFGNFVASGMQLGEDLELTKTPTTLFGATVALFGPESDFRRRLIRPTVADISPMETLPSAAWCGAATARFKVPCPVLGDRPFEEDVRIAMSCEEGVPTSLAVQFSSKLAVGFPVGDFLTETLHILTQDVQGGPVRLRSLGLVHKKGYEAKGLAGLREERKSFSEVAQGFLETTMLDVLQLQLPSVSGERDDVSIGQISTFAPSMDIASFGDISEQSSFIIEPPEH